MNDTCVMNFRYLGTRRCLSSFRQMEIVFQLNVGKSTEAVTMIIAKRNSSKMLENMFQIHEYLQ